MTMTCSFAIKAYFGGFTIVYANTMCFILEFLQRVTSCLMVYNKIHASRLKDMDFGVIIHTMYMYHWADYYKLHIFLDIQKESNENNCDPI